MGSRTRVKPNPAAGSSTATSSSAMPSQSSSEPSQSHASAGTNATTRTVTPQVEPGTPRSLKQGGSGDGTPTPVQGLKQAHKTRSWYGSFPRVSKSAASTQVARETILGGTSKPQGTVDFSKFEQKKQPDATNINEVSLSSSPASKMQEDRGSMEDQQRDTAPPAVEDHTKTEGETKTEDGAKPEDKTKPEIVVDTQVTGSGETEQRTEPAAGQSAEPAAEPAATSPVDQPTTVESTSQRPASGWLPLGWLGWSAPASTEPNPSAPTSASEAGRRETDAPQESSATTKQPDVKPPEPVTEMQQAQTAPDSGETPEQPQEQEKAQDKAGATSRTSWLWSWSSRSAPAPSQPEISPPTAESEAPPPKEPEDVAVQDVPAPTTEQPSPAPKAGSTWAFWSRDTGSASQKQPAQQGEQGQLAVMGERSERQPQRANSMEFESAPVKEPPLKAGRKDDKRADTLTTSSRESSSKSNSRARPRSTEIEAPIPARPSSPKADTAIKPGPKTPTSAKASPPNLLLPSFSGTYKLKDNPSIIKQIAQLLLRSQQPSAKHVYLRKEPPKIRKAVAIGVHGLFPANYLRPMIGQPTGTSIKFANHCAEAIRRWADSHGCEDCEIEKIALEGEGKIAERVENLWKLLLNWIDQIRSADLILIACHSQGVPVSIILLAKLIELGIVTSAKVGVCAMAGVTLGPFPDYRSSMGRLMGTAAELWEFADPQSEVSKRLEASIKAVLSHGARITFVGSIDDQLVPLESAIYAPAHHPYIFRSVFIDGRIHAPDFIAHLVGFALKLRNLGVSDHGLIRELSTPLAGSLYSGEGHSRLYDDERVYDLAVTHALETTDVAGPSCECEVRHRPGQGAGGLSNPNPYHLPWIMRGLLEEDFVKTELSAETEELVRQFDDWKPVTKALKDVKYRLEAVRSKL
ncbi:uncharacterized protein B0T15DRAFT_300365 [Chaetomium strumarium]|uniref:YMC020W-like alpha/beta hydrolase domain-containing protein n=1 Tax=Chaetomium strumarium TaxID=1170767 RepID=A0AAJ0LYI6_9PEZI|nr:hypothetical protein B0T15DRAFT_300365 [Chaetomium strumarium]